MIQVFMDLVHMVGEVVHGSGLHTGWVRWFKDAVVSWFVIQVHRVGFMDLVHMVGEVVQGSGPQGG